MQCGEPSLLSFKTQAKPRDQIPRSPVQPSYMIMCYDPLFIATTHGAQTVISGKSRLGDFSVPPIVQKS